MEAALRVCANCRVLVEPSGTGWQHVPEFAAKFDRTVCDRPEEGRVPSGSETRFGLGRQKSSGRDKHSLNACVDELALPEGTPVILAADGSYKLTVGEKVIKPMSWGYLATNGQYGLGTSIITGRVVGGDPRADGSDPGRTLQAELRAIANGLQAVDYRRHPVTVLSDSADALRFLTLWRDGHDVMPGGYSRERTGDREATLVRLARRLREDSQYLDWQWVRGHSGHPLNEGADSLAKMARAWATGTVDRDTVTTQARLVAISALVEHAQTCPA